jgi:aryl-alcohol dehydrogenase-like predicted oxidoreductase
VERRTLGHSDLTITAIGLGAWAIGGGDWVLGWGPQQDAASLATIRRAVDWGINWIDTAAAYGLGHSETIVARALRDIPRRERPLVFTKCGLVWDDLGNVSHSLEPQSIRRQAEASLRRLAVECIDLYQIGWPVWPDGPAHDDDRLEEAWDTMASLQCEGKARFVGVSNCDVNQLARLCRIAPIVSLQTPWSLLRHAPADCRLSFCADHDIGVIACSTMQSGLLTGRMTRDRIAALPHNDWRHRSPDFQEPILSQAMGLIDRLRSIGLRHAQTPGEVAIAWALHNPVVTAASVGARHPHQVDHVVGGSELQLTAEEIDELECECAAPAQVC